MKIEFSKRCELIEPLIFNSLNSYRKKEGLIDLSRGVPFGGPPRELIYELNMRNKYDENHIYTDNRGLKELREEISYYYKENYDVNLDPETEVQVLIGSKEGIANLLLATINTGDHVIVPNPSFPVYFNGVRFAGGNFTWAMLDWENKFLPDYKKLASNLSGKEKLMIVNYPHSPTGAVCSLKDLEDAYNFATDNNLIILFDAVYRELAFKKHPTMLQVKDAKNCSVEIGSLSKTFNMTGWRIAYMVGNKDVIAKVNSIKTIFDVGQFVPIQFAATLAMKMVSYIENAAEDYLKKVEKAVVYLKEAGIEYHKPGAAYSIWCKVPKGYKSSFEFIQHLCKDHNLLFMPGVGYGSNGENYFRISLTKPESIVVEGLNNFKNIMLRK